MECKYCNNICNDTNIRSDDTKNIAIILNDGTISCVPCSEIDFLFGNDLSINKITQKNQPINQPINQQIKCPKCKIKFSGKKCLCGFKNPLLR
jgi:hypothetical protein